MTREELDHALEPLNLYMSEISGELRVHTVDNRFVCSISEKMVTQLTFEQFSKHYLKLPNCVD